jgi:putative PIN family toxin of toxin-antitoxin system
MRVVIDTNVLVSGLLSPRGAPPQIVRLVSSAELIVCRDERILGEYESVLGRPEFPFFKTSEVAALLEQIRKRGETVPARHLALTLPHASNLPFLEVAVAGRVQYLVTGNRRHFPRKPPGGLRIVSPAEFLALYRERN